MKTILQLSIAFALFLAGGKAQAQTGTDLDTSFDIGTGFSFGTEQCWLNTIALQLDGKILVGGRFTEYNGQSQNRITRLNIDGTLDTTFNIGIGFQGGNGSVNSTIINVIVLQPDGKILVGGNFSSYDGQSKFRIARLNTDGSLDMSFGSLLDDRINTVGLQSDGKIIVGGPFTGYNMQSQNRIARLNTDGTLDSSFNIGTGFGQTLLNVFLEAVTIQPDGKILAGGRFTSYNGQSRNHIVRLETDGSLDTSFNIGTGFSGSGGLVRAITLQPDGKIIVGGHFSSYNGQSRKNIVRLNTDGTLDTSFNIGTGFNNDIRTIILQPDGKIIVGGHFSSYNGQTQKGIVRLNANGDLDTSFDIGTGFYGSVHSMVMQPDEKILLAGGFTSYNGQTQNGIARLFYSSLSTEDFDQSTISIYPNPVSDDFMISVPSSNVEIFDVLGKKVFEQENVNYSVNISHLSKGLYIVKGQTEKGVFTAKIVKQ